jgi:hypothetical protein
MQLGAPKWEAAEYLGMTAKQLEDVYGHHHPDHLKAPRQAFDARSEPRRNDESVSKREKKRLSEIEPKSPAAGRRLLASHTGTPNRVDLVRQKYCLNRIDKSILRRHCLLV